MKRSDDDLSSEYLIILNSTYWTIKAERTLLKNNLYCRLITAPRSIRSDCGLALIINRKDKKEILDLMIENSIGHYEIYSQDDEENWRLIETITKGNDL